MILGFDPQTSFLLLVALLNFVLGAFVFLRNNKQSVGKSFGLMTLFVSLWSFAGFIFVVIPGSGPDAVLAGHVLYYVAALLPTSFLIMTLAFPPYSLLNKKVLIPLMIELVAVLYLTSREGLVIQDLLVVDANKILTWGKYYYIYVLHHTVLFTFGYVVLFTKFIKATGVSRNQLLFVILGTILPANAALTTNLIMPWYGNYEYYTWMGQIFMILLVAFSGYAIFKYKLFDIKVIAAETFVIASSITLLVRFILSESTADRVVGGVLFIFVTIFGIFLIRSVWKEVETRKELEELTDQLAYANDQLKVLDKARAEFISVASHQLRTPPATIKWYLAAVLAGDYGKLSPKVRESITKAQVTNNDLIGLIDDMLNASRIERGKMEFIFEESDIVKLVDNVVIQLVPQATLKKMELVWSKPKQKFPSFLADKEKLAQVVNNLIDNAIKYSKSGKIFIELSKTKTDFIIKIKDQGKGVAKEELESIFTKYGRGKDSKHQSSGLGLGLYVARVVVEFHKGKIWAESKGLNKGTTFVVSLPIKTDLKAETFDFAKPDAPQ